MKIIKILIIIRTIKSCKMKTINPFKMNRIELDRILYRVFRNISKAIKYDI